MKEPLVVKLEQGEQTPAQREMRLVEIWQKGLDTLDCVAYHYTSLEAIEYLITNGGLPGHTEPDSESPKLPQHGDIYFQPRPLNFPFKRIRDIWDKTGTPQDIMEGIVLAIARGHRFCSFLELDIAVYGANALDYVDSVDDGIQDISFLEEQKALAQLGLPEDKIREAIEAARKRKGIVIGLTRSALDKFPSSVGDGGYDFRLSTGLQGLPTSALSGIKLLGEEETAFFKSLQTKTSV